MDDCWFTFTSSLLSDLQVNASQVLTEVIVKDSCPDDFCKQLDASGNGKVVSIPKLELPEKKHLKMSIVSSVQVKRQDSQ